MSMPPRPGNPLHSIKIIGSRSIHFERRHSRPGRKPLARLNLAQLRHEMESCMHVQNSKRGSTNTAKIHASHSGSTRGPPLDHLCVLDTGMHGIFWNYVRAAWHRFTLSSVSSSCHGCVSMLSMALCDLLAFWSKDSSSWALSLTHFRLE